MSLANRNRLNCSSSYIGEEIEKLGMEFRQGKICIFYEKKKQKKNV